MTDSLRSQFSLPHWGWFLSAAAVLVVAYGALSIWIPCHREQQIVQKIEGWGGQVETQKCGPEWLRSLVGDEFMKPFDRVIWVSLSNSPIDDADLAHLTGLTKLELLKLSNTQISDAGLVHLKGLANLEILSLKRTQITGAGLAHLSDLKNLEWLDLNGTQIGDTGLVHLTGLTNLGQLRLRETQVTDAGLAYLSGMTKLKELWLGKKQVTDQRFEALQKALPACAILR